MEDSKFWTSTGPGMRCDKGPGEIWRTVLFHRHKHIKQPAGRRMRQRYIQQSLAVHTAQAAQFAGSLLGPDCAQSVHQPLEQNHAQEVWGTEVLLSELSQCAPSRRTWKEIQSGDNQSFKQLACSLSQGDRVLFLRRYWFCETLNALARNVLHPTSWRDGCTA